MDFSAHNRLCLHDLTLQARVLQKTLRDSRLIFVGPTFKSYKLTKRVYKLSNINEMTKFRRAYRKAK